MSIYRIAEYEQVSPRNPKDLPTFRTIASFAELILPGFWIKATDREYVVDRSGALRRSRDGVITPRKHGRTGREGLR